MKYNHSVDHFNKIARNYDRFKKQNSFYYHTLKRGIASFIPKKNLSILDIGCGTGELLNFLSPKNGIGIDHSIEMIKIATQKYKKLKNLSFYVCDIEKHPVHGRFDFILFIDVIEHILFKEKAMENIGKSMSENSTLIISMANPLWEPFLLILEKLHLKMPEGPHVRLSEKECVALLAKYHLTIIQKKYFLPALPLPFVSRIALVYMYAIRKDTYNAHP